LAFIFDLLRIDYPTGQSLPKYQTIYTQKIVKISSFFGGVYACFVEQSKLEVILLFRSGFVLSTVAHIEAAILNQQPVTVWMDGRLVDYGGVI